jgi:hypothetical protein
VGSDVIVCRCTVNEYRLARDAVCRVGNWKRLRPLRGGARPALSGLTRSGQQFLDSQGVFGGRMRGKRIAKLFLGSTLVARFIQRQA